MNKFYTDAANPHRYEWRRKNLEDKNPNSFLIAFIDSLFVGLLEKLYQLEKLEFVGKLKILVMCHIQNGSQEYDCLNGEDFSLVRCPLYKYSKRAQ